jgi:hypothetical protein
MGEKEGSFSWFLKLNVVLMKTISKCTILE